MAVPKMVYLFNFAGRPFTLGRCLLDELQCASDQMERVSLTMSGSAACELRVSPDVGLPLAHSPDCPCRIFCRQYCLSFQHSTRVDVAVQVVIESVDGYFLIARQDLHLLQFPKAWGTLGGPLAPGEHFEQVIVRKADNAGVKLLYVDGELTYQGSPCYCHPFFLFENVYPVKLEFGLPMHQQLMVFHHLLLPVTARSVRLVTKNEVDICVWLSVSQLLELRDRTTIDEIDGVWKQNKSCRVSYLQLAGPAPNEVGEGFARSSWSALWHWIDNRSE